MKKDKDNKKKPFWIKITEGTLILRTPREMRIKHKERIHATVPELGKYVDNFELLQPGIGKYKVTKKDLEKASPKAEKEKAKSTPAPDKEEYTLVAKGGGYFDILNPSGDKENQKPLKEKKARLLLDELNSEGDE